MLALFVRLQVALISLFATARTRRMAQARAITFIEYAILAAIAVGIGILFRTQLAELFNNLFGKLNTAVDTQTK